ncbi:MAG: calcium-binding protein [Thalassovita sp.]
MGPDPSYINDFVIDGTAQQFIEDYADLDLPDLEFKPEGYETDGFSIGTDGPDFVVGTDGDDGIYGGISETDLADRLFGGDGNDYIDGGYGNDELRGDASHDTIVGGFGVDSIFGGAGNDVLTGSTYSDLIFGGDGFDFINGGFGSDLVNGREDGDRFFHLGAVGHGSDWIQDYSADQGDALQFGQAGSLEVFQVNFAETTDTGAAGVSEAFVIHRPTAQILWALVDGAAQSQIALQIAGVDYDLLG